MNQVPTGATDIVVTYVTRVRYDSYFLLKITFSIDSSDSFFLINCLFYKMSKNGEQCPSQLPRAKREAKATVQNPKMSNSE